jgi:hypothetical protein
MFKEYLTGPVFAALGNHDTSPENINAPYNLPGPLGEQQSWNYEHVAGLWKHEGWIDEKTAAEARTHYGGYSVKTHYGLRIIAFNTGKSTWILVNYVTTDSIRFLVREKLLQLHQLHRPRQLWRLFLDD